MLFIKDKIPRRKLTVCIAQRQSGGPEAHRGSPVFLSIPVPLSIPEHVSPSSLVPLTGGADWIQGNTWGTVLAGQPREGDERESLQVTE